MSVLPQRRATRGSLSISSLPQTLSTGYSCRNSSLHREHNDQCPTYRPIRFTPYYFQLHYYKSTRRKDPYAREFFDSDRDKWSGKNPRCLGLLRWQHYSVNYHIFLSCRITSIMFDDPATCTKRLNVSRIRGFVRSEDSWVHCIRWGIPISLLGDGRRV